MMLSALLTGLLWTPALVAGPAGVDGADAEGKVKVFVLAGQSNMEGKGFPEPLAWQVSQEEYRERYTRFIKDGDHDSFTRTLQESLAADARKPVYDWSEREDVWVKFLGKHGNLTVGYAAPSKCFGPEYEFGHVMGDLFDEQVLLIKTAWGGKSLGKDFLPPSAKQPSDEEYAEMVRQKNEQIAKNNERNREKLEGEGRGDAFKPKPEVSEAELREGYGFFYRAMIEDVKQTLADPKAYFPSYAGQGVELVGMVWFQGWNDQFNDAWCDDYEAHMACFIRDVRADLGAPGMRAVIGVVGFDGLKEPQKGKDGGDSNRTKMQKAQAAMASLAEFEGEVGAVETAPFWDMDAEAIYRGPGGWSADVKKWQQFGNDRPYHYYGSPWFFAQTGRALGECMRGLLGGSN